MQTFAEIERRRMGEKTLVAVPAEACLGLTKPPAEVNCGGTTLDIEIIPKEPAKPGQRQTK